MDKDTELTTQNAKDPALPTTSSDLIFEQPPTLQSLKSYFQNKCSRENLKNLLVQKLPIIQWLPQYNCNTAIGDLVAGITVGLTVIPHGLAFANIAGIPVQYGLYTAFLGCFVYIIFGTCKASAIGPTAISSVLLHEVLGDSGPEYAIVLCFLTGIMELIMGVLGLGFLVNFISGPVSSGFVSAGAVIIVSSQIKDFLGINVKGSSFIRLWKGIFKEIHNTRVWDTIFGICCMVVLIAFTVLSKIRVGPPTDRTKCQNNTNTIIWLVGISCNAILLIFSAIIGYGVSTHEELPFKVVGHVPKGLPSFQVPDFNNVTESVPSVISGILKLSLLGLLEDIAVCKAFMKGKPVDATQELIAIGLSNIANSFVQGIPGTAGLARSAINVTSGVNTTLGGLYTGIIVITALVFFTPFFKYIPKPTLSAITIYAALFMIEFRIIKPMWKAKKRDLFIALVTFFVCLGTRLEYGILAGIAADIIFILYQAARPKFLAEKMKSPKGVEYLFLTPDRNLIFPSANYVRNLVIKQSTKQGIPIVIDCTHVYGVDYTAAKVIESLTKDFKSRNQPLFFYNLKPNVNSVFVGLNLPYFFVYYSEEEFDTILKKWSKAS